MNRTFCISGQWVSGQPDYSTWEILPKPKYPSPMWTDDDRWRELRMPAWYIKRSEIIDWLKVEYGKDCRMDVKEFRQNGQEVFITFIPHSSEGKANE